jgi:hypothetical protein
MEYDVQCVFLIRKKGDGNFMRRIIGESTSIEPGHLMRALERSARAAIEKASTDFTVKPEAAGTHHD